MSATSTPPPSEPPVPSTIPNGAGRRLAVLFEWIETGHSPYNEEGTIIFLQAIYNDLIGVGGDEVTRSQAEPPVVREELKRENTYSGAVEEARAYVKAHGATLDPVVNMMRRLLGRFDYVVAYWKEEEESWLGPQRDEPAAEVPR